MGVKSPEKCDTWRGRWQLLQKNECSGLHLTCPRAHFRVVQAAGDNGLMLLLPLPLPLPLLPPCAKETHPTHDSSHHHTRKRARMQVLRVYSVDSDSACGLGDYHAFRCANRVVRPAAHVTHACIARYAPQTLPLTRDTLRPGTMAHPPRILSSPLGSRSTTPPPPLPPRRRQRP